MNRTQKEDLVAHLRSEFEAAQSVILTSYQGIEVNEINELRKTFREEGVEYHTIKNTLARRAVEGTDKEQLAELFTGPISIAYSPDDAVSPAKIVKDFAKGKEEKFTVLGGILDGELLDVAGVNHLANLPTKDELRVQMLLVFQAGPTQLLRTLSAGPLDFLRVFEAKRMAEEG